MPHCVFAFLLSCQLSVPPYSSPSWFSPSVLPLRSPSLTLPCTLSYQFIYQSLFILLLHSFLPLFFLCNDLPSHFHVRYLTSSSIRASLFFFFIVFSLCSSSVITFPHTSMYVILPVRLSEPLYSSSSWFSPSVLPLRSPSLTLPCTLSYQFIYQSLFILLLHSFLPLFFLCDHLPSHFHVRYLTSSSIRASLFFFFIVFSLCSSSAITFPHTSMYVILPVHLSEPLYSSSS